MEGRAGRRLGIALVALALLTAQGSVARASDPPTQALHLVVHFAPGASAAARAAAVRAIGGSVEGEIPALGITRIALVVEQGTDPAALLRAIGAQPSVAGVEADRRVHTDWTPNDPFWNADPYSGLGQWGDKKILLDRARDLTGALAPVIVAVVDTGVDAGHPDLAGVVLPGVTFLSAQSPGCSADAIGTDDNSHGTHVAGIIAANANNGIGIAGVAPNARILPVKALDCTGSGSTFDVAQGITYAVDHGARLVNVSLGSSSANDPILSAVQYAIAHDVLIVAAAGNCGNAARLGPSCLATQNLPEYPAAYPGVLAVGATAADDSIASFSTQGTQVGVSAPGVNIVSTTPHYPTYQSQRGGTMNYASFSGTSQATPFVTGSAALLLGVDPTLTARQLTDRLKTSADDLGAPGTDNAFGAGRVDLARAVSATLPAFSAKYDTTFVPRSATTAATFTAKVAITNTSASVWSAAGTSAVKLSYHWLDLNGNVVVWDGVRTSLPSDVAPGTTVTADMTVLAPPARGTYILRIDLARDGLTWFSQRGVTPADVIVAVGSGVGASYALGATSSALVTATPAPLTVLLKNTGARPWSAAGPSPVRLSYHWLRYGVVTVWDGPRSDALPADVPPGGSASVQLMVIPPPEPGPYTLRLDLVEEGVSWFSAEGVPPLDIPYAITTGFGADYAPATTTAELATNAPAALSVMLTNTGTRPWAASGGQAVRLSYHWLRYGEITTWDGTRAAFTADVLPGASAQVELMVVPPAEPGVYTLRLDLVEDGVAWFSDKSVAPSDVRYIVSRGG